MFGKPEWFEYTNSGNIPVPKTKSGWAYYGLMAVAIGLPSALLISRMQIPELVIWVVVCFFAFRFEIKRLRRAGSEKKALENLYFIGDTAESVVETEKYRLEIKK